TVARAGAAVAAVSVPEPLPVPPTAENVSVSPVSGPGTEMERRLFHVSLPSGLVLGVAAALVIVAGLVATRSLRSAVPSRAAGAKTTLAVLPLQNLSADPGQDFFTDGFTEEMIAELGKLDPDRLGVIARTTTMLYKNAGKTVGQIRKELGVDYVLEGSIR